MSTPATRLSVDDWIQAGFGIIAEEGLKAIKIDRVCKRLGVTKGSFYWHFTDLGAYLDALAESWGTATNGIRAEWVELEALEPRERLTRMMMSLIDDRHWMLERAMREWARTDPSVAAKIELSDRWSYRMITRVFLDAGYSAEDAGTRARIVFYTGVGFVHVGGGPPNDPRAAAERQRFIDLVLPPGPS
jgi:AcrR family transcriptional regulator